MVLAHTEPARCRRSQDSLHPTNEHVLARRRNTPLVPTTQQPFTSLRSPNTHGVGPHRQQTGAAQSIPITGSSNSSQYNSNDEHDSRSHRLRSYEEWLTTQSALDRTSSPARGAPLRGWDSPNDAAIYEIRAFQIWPTSREYARGHRLVSEVARVWDRQLSPQGFNAVARNFNPERPMHVRPNRAYLTHPTAPKTENLVNGAASVSPTPHDDPNPAAVDQGDGARLGDASRGVENLEGDQVALIIVVENHAGLGLVALGDRCIAQHDGQDVGLGVVVHSHLGLHCSFDTP